MSVQQTPRIPSTEREAYAWGYMIGYMGEVPDAMRPAFSDVAGELAVPQGIRRGHLRAYALGYNDGLDMYSSHSDEED
jgi:hypothetical protein